MSEEGEHQVCGDVLYTQLRWPLPETASRKFEQKPERVSIRFAGVGTVAALNRHVLSEKGSDEGRDGCQATSLPTRASADAAMSVISSGVASRYQ